jgi:hypothetical protein
MVKSSAPERWATTVIELDDAFPRVFREELAAAWASFEIVYSYTRYSGPVKPLAAGYGWKARLTRPGAEGFLWIRGSKTEAGIARIVGDAPDEASAHALVDIGRRLLRVTRDAR